jgi:hypothetical protein
MLWTHAHDVDLGYLPFFLDANDPRPAAEQIDAHYQHGGGWQSFKGFERLNHSDLQYPGDPPLHPIAMTRLRDEEIYVYPYSWVMVLQPDGAFDIARID